MELPRDLFEEMVAHARAGHPNEACGVIAGRGGRPSKVFLMRNAEASPMKYEFDSEEHLQVVKEIDAKRWEQIAFFHSHPNTEAYPSRTDRERAHVPDPVTGQMVPWYPGVRYLILSLAERRPVLRAFTFRDGEPVEEEVRIS